MKAWGGQTGGDLLKLKVCPSALNVAELNTNSSQRVFLQTQRMIQAGDDSLHMWNRIYFCFKEVNLFWSKICKSA